MTAAGQSALDAVVARMAEATSSFLQPAYLEEGFSAVPDDLLAALLAERRADGLAQRRRVHVQGWEMFGVVHLTRTDLRDHTSRPIEDPVEWPDGEINKGIFCVTVQTHGDDPAGAYVKVVGTDRLNVESCFTRTANATRALLGAVWPGDPALICVKAGDVRALRPLFTALAEDHGLTTVVDELAGAARLDAVIDALVGLVGWSDLVTAVVTCKPRTPTEPEPF